ncbi:hypothetical protein [Mesorhizobium sp.]|uniref:hypothetical protein n=2 Tax=Mesorhizobium sp. TaxID=1871066 RepID=UPI0025BF59B3|nr:hypothetical protein [Mesorhizobium sp.]
MAKDGCASASLIAAQRTGKAAAHADAMKAACKSSGEDHEVVDHWRFRSAASASLLPHKIDKKDDKADGAAAIDEEAEHLWQASVSELENGVL